MSDLTPLSLPSSTTDVLKTAVPVYRYLMHQPEHWLRQAFFVDRPRLPISHVVESMRANNQTLQEAAQDWLLPVAAVEEALDYYNRFRDRLDADAVEEIALSDELARRSSES